MTFTRALPFQSTFPRGERRGPYLIFLSPCRFQSTFPRGERHLCWLVAVKHIHFNPRSLVGNDVLRRAACPLLFYFNPRSLVGNDGNQNIRRNQNGNFNPRSLVGNDLLPFLIGFLYLLFQSTFPRGERHTGLGGGVTDRLFQSTFPRGERRPKTITGADIADFNPRSLVGNDGKFSQIFFVFLCNKYNFSTFYYPFSLFFSVIHVTFLIFVVRILPAFYVYF